MTLNQRQQIQFKEAALPLMNFIHENSHPHCKAIVSGNQAELLGGIASVQASALNTLEDKREAQRQALLTAAKNFVAKVECGAAKSQLSYAEFKAALDLLPTWA